MAARKITICEILAMLLLVTGPCLGQSWEYGPDTDFQLFRFDGICFPDDGNVYFLGGRLENGTTIGTIWRFDPVSSMFSDTGAVMPYPIANYSLEYLDDDTGTGIYAVGGRLDDGSPSEHVQVYYPATNTATALAGDEWPASPSRVPGGVIKHDNVLFVFGGLRSTPSPTLFAETWTYDPSLASGSRWTHITTADLSIARTYLFGCVVDGYAYAIGGETYEYPLLVPSVRTERLLLSNPTLGWDDASVAELTDGAGEGQAFGFESSAAHAYAGHIVLVAGTDNWPYQWNRCFDYTIANDTWSGFPSLDQARRNHAGALIENGPDAQIWVFGGCRFESEEIVLNSTEHYDLSAPTPTPAPTSPPTPTATPTVPTATPGIPTATPACDALGVDLWMPDDFFRPGDPCSLRVHICNPGPETYTDIPVFVILDVFGMYFFAPSFTAFDHYTIPLPAGMQTFQIIPEFTWPSGVGSALGLLWYSAMTDPGITQLFGEMDTWMFSYGN